MVSANHWLSSIKINRLALSKHPATQPSIFNPAPPVEVNDVLAFFHAHFDHTIFNKPFTGRKYFLAVLNNTVHFLKNQRKN